MKPTELSKLFNFSARKKYDMMFDPSSEHLKDANNAMYYGCFVVACNDNDSDVFPYISVAILVGEKVEDGEHSYIVRSLAEMSTTYTVRDGKPLGDYERPVVLITGGTPKTARVVGYKKDGNYLTVKILGDLDVKFVSLDDVQTIEVKE